jgi:hypothetical protein
MTRHQIERTFQQHHGMEERRWERGHRTRPLLALYAIGRALRGEKPRMVGYAQVDQDLWQNCLIEFALTESPITPNFRSGILADPTAYGVERYSGSRETDWK